MTEKPLAEMIAELRRLDAEATPAPWRWDAGDEVIAGPPTIDTDAESPATAFGKRSVIIETDSGYYGPHGADREIIPAMRNALPRLLDELQRRREERPAVTLDEHKVVTTAANELYDLARRMAQALVAAQECVDLPVPEIDDVLDEARKLRLLR